MHAGGEERVDEAAGIADDAGEGEAVRAGVVGEVGGGFHLGDALAGADQLQEIRGVNEGVREEVGRRGGGGFFFGGDFLVHDYADGGCAVV